ncbi:MAG: ribosome assembly factor SBDS [Candidatus Aenigmarchaeota archaeon]|nr:ribosome assembly factor SBDS [Candidatus Aenigmarchaeota archaeon]
MISVDKAVIAKLVKSGNKFEMLVDPDKSLEVKMGKQIPLDDLIASEEVFEDSKKGLRASSENINKAFGTTDVNTIVNIIIKDGEVQLTTEQRRQMAEDKKKAIASIISKRGINPQTNLPHPMDRILRAMDEAKVKIELDKRVEEQIETTISALQKVMPLRIEKLQIAVKITPQFAGKAGNIIRSFGTLLKEEWGKDGSLITLIEIPAGIQQEVYDRLNNLTHGQVEVKIVKKVGE